MLTRAVLGIVWLLHFLPLAVLAPIGAAVGALAYVLVVPRRRVCLVNLSKCFPELSERERRALARAHFRLLGRFMLEHGVIWWGSRARLERMVQFEEREHLDAHAGRPLIIVAPHFLGLDIGDVRLSITIPLASMYQKQKDPALDRRIARGRTRFAPEGRLFSRQEGLRPLARLIKSGVAFYYLPDMDLGARDSVFVPFFGVQTATVTGLARLARLTGARVVPCVTRMLPGGAGYCARFYPAWTDFPTDDVHADTRRLNAFIEARVREMPAQYYWVHKRFKTRPAGEAGFYS